MRITICQLSCVVPRRSGGEEFIQIKEERNDVYEAECGFDGLLNSSENISGKGMLCGRDLPEATAAVSPAKCVVS